jgi:outer membrane PBP1 activator LpoA protein
MQHQYKEATVQRIYLQKVFNDHVFQNINQRKLWLDLVSLTIPELTIITIENKDTQLAGWAKLALISKQGGWNKFTLMKEIANWQENNSKHPANSLLPTSLNELEKVLINPPKKMAVLLPLSGELSGPGHAIREGFLDAYNRDNSKNKINVLDQLFI